MANEFARFMEACGGVEPLRLAVLSGGGRPVAVQFDKPAVVVGRDPGADLQLPDPTVAPRHLYLQLVGGRLFGVHLADDAVTQRGADEWTHGWVQPGDVFTVGQTRFRVLNPVHRPDLPPPADDPLTTDSAPADGYHLEPLWDEARSAGLIASRRALLLIGQSGPTWVTIDHPSVAPVHAALVRTPDGLWVADLGSAAGVTVNGVPVPAGPVGHRDRIGVGEADLRVHLTGDSLPPAVHLVPRPAAVQADLAPVLAQMAEFQRQTFDQFREMMAAMMQMVGTVMADQRQFIRDEMDRLERLAAGQDSTPAALPAAAPAARPSVSASTPLSLPRLPGTPSPSAADVHAWLTQQLGVLERERTTVWQRLVQTITTRLRGCPPGARAVTRGASDPPWKTPALASEWHTLKTA